VEVFFHLFGGSGRRPLHVSLPKQIVVETDENGPPPLAFTGKRLTLIPGLKRFGYNTATP
jgi:hypothetical protein